MTTAVFSDMLQRLQTFDAWDAAGVLATSAEEYFKCELGPALFAIAQGDIKTKTDLLAKLETILPGLRTLEKVLQDGLSSQAGWSDAERNFYSELRKDIAVAKTGQTG